MIKIIGRIQSIRYPKKYSNGDWAVFYVDVTKVVDGEIDKSFKINKNYPIILPFSGETPSLHIGAEYMITGEFSESKYGPQYAVIIMNENVDFDTPGGKRAFLENIIPPTIIRSLYSKFDDPIELLKNRDIDSLMTVKGIGASVAQRLIKRYDETADNYGRAFVALQPYGVTIHMIKKMCNKLKSQDRLIELVKENPYCLIDEVDGIGWAKADQMAKEFGIPENSECRINACIKFCFDEFANKNGHTWVYDGNLLDVLVATLNIPDKDKIIYCVKKKIADKEIFYDQGKRRVGLMRYRSLEHKIAKELKRIINGGNINVEYIDETIKKCEDSVGFTYTDEQKEIIKNVLTTQNVAVVTGLAGTGKSSIMYPITSALSKNGYEIAQVALSGKAALNLTEITGINGSTIHRLLAYDGEKFIYDESNKLPYDVIIIDELSMVGGQIFCDLIKSIKTGAKLIAIGDPGQLESIGLCNCLYDIISSGVIPHYHLTKIMRQAQDSAIITESAKVYNREQIIPNGFSGETVRGVNRDFQIISAIDSAECSKIAVDKFKELYFDNKVNIDDICIITCKRSIGSCSARELNSIVHSMVTNKEDDMFISKNYFDSVKYTIEYRAGDKVLITKNCYNTISESGKPAPIFNGNIGVVKWVEPYNKTMCVSFQQEDIILDKDCLDNVQLGYAMTCHKTQGSGFKYVIAIIDPSAYTLNSKEMLYTQITRAKKHCTLIGPTTIIRNATTRTNVRTKQTWLKELLQGEFNSEVV